MLVTVKECERLVCPFRRNPDGSDAKCISVGCMLWKWSNSICPRTRLQLGRCGVPWKEAGSWRLVISQGIATRAASSADGHPAPTKGDVL